MPSDGFEETDSGAESPNEEETEYEEVFPIVAVQSNGGEYDDTAFIAGMYCGMVHTFLQTTTHALYEAYVPTGTVPQLDLIAMSHGWVTQSTPWEGAPEEWAFIVFTRSMDELLEEAGVREPWEIDVYDQDEEE